MNLLGLLYTYSSKKGYDPIYSLKLVLTYAFSTFQ